MLLPFFSMGQEIKKSETDEFTGAKKIETTAERLAFDGTWTLYVSGVKLDSIELLHFNVLIEKYRNRFYTISEGQKIMLKLQNDSVVSLSAAKYSQSCKGCGSVNIMGSSAEGISILYHIDAKAAALLKENPVVKIRLYNSLGYVDGDIKKKFSGKISSIVALIE